MLRKIGFLTNEQFENAIKHSRVSQKGIIAAKKVLVEKISQAQVAQEIGVSREKVRQYCFSIYTKHIKTNSCPPGWISTTVCLPIKNIKEIQLLEKKMRLELERKTNKPS